MRFASRHAPIKAIMMKANPALSADELARFALQLRDQDDPEGAVVLLRDGTQRYPGEPIVWQCLGLVQRALLESAEAMAALEKAAALSPQDGRIVQALAHVTLEAGLPAVELFDRARELLPHDGSVLIGRSAAQLAEGQASAAVADLETVCAANPQWLEGHAALADLKWLLGDENGFASSFTDALAREPQSFPLWLGLLGSHLRVDRFEGAQQALDAARQTIGDRPELVSFSAICASELGDNANADALFAGLLAQEPYRSDIDLVVRGVRHLLRTGREAQAAALAQTMLRHPEAAKMWPYMATAWRMLDDPQWHWLEGDERLVKQIKLYEPDELAPLADCLRRLHRAPHEPAGQSVRSGSQTDGPLFARLEPEIRELRRRIETAVAQHIVDLGPPDSDHPTLRQRPRKVRFAGSWSVRLQGAGHHSNHIHPQGWLSSAFYVAVPPVAESGPAPAGHLQLGVPPIELEIDLAAARRIAPEAGWLTLFPSTMWHGTAPIAGGERMTVAFDVKG